MNCYYSSWRSKTSLVKVFSNEAVGLRDVGMNAEEKNFNFPIRAMLLTKYPRIWLVSGLSAVILCYEIRQALLDTDQW